MCRFTQISSPKFSSRNLLFHTESTESTELPVLWQYFTLRWNPRNCRLGLKPCDWLRGVSANVLRSHCANRHDEVYDKFCGFKFFCVHFLLIRLRVKICVFCEFCVRIFSIQFTIRLIPSIRLSVLKLISNPTFLFINLKYVRSCL